MKHIKLFESITKSKYWEVNTKHGYLEVALNKINMPPDNIKIFCEIFFGEVDDKYVKIFEDYDDEDQSYSWTWSDLNYIPPSWSNPKFMGRVKVEGWEVAIIKYNL